MSAPRATMRLQFHSKFTFAQASALAPYFASLGVSHIYASPVTTARPGSMHGYDTIDPTRVNPELGGEDELRRLVAVLRRHEMGLIVDIVPNHMAIGSGNAWWMDVLANGLDSRYARYFDIDWNPADPRLRGKVLLPVLGRPYGETLAAGELTLRLDTHGRPTVRYFDREFPLAAVSADTVDKGALKNVDAKTPEGRARLHRLLEAQHYRLAWWRVANDEINWRRFFDINELAAIRVEDDEVFEAVHAAIFRLYAQGLVDGLRVDHIDGLALPGDYCCRLRSRLRELEGERPPDCPSGPAYVVVEKILAYGERLPQSWQTDGTTGYDFMDEVSALQHDSAGEQPLTDLWVRLSGRTGAFKKEEERARREILQRSFSAQLESVLDVLFRIAQDDPATRDISSPALRRCLTEILVHFPVYRIYARVEDASPADIAFLSEATAHAAETCLPSDRWLVETLGDWLMGRRIRADADVRQTVALIRFQQLSAPLSAKAVEDTAFYRYGRLISRNDVGFNPARFACSVGEFHERMRLRAATFAHALLATATHDHKRGEDSRARLAVISEVADEWADAVERWMKLCAEHFPASGEKPLPCAADRLMLFETIVGAWPLWLQPGDRDGIGTFAKRIAAWQQKALREAKVESDWSAPNEAYERAANELVAWIFAESSPVLADIARFVHRIAPAGAVNGLAQVLIKLTAPGVPDFYQGDEYWDFSLVDPDNRIAVDFAARQQSLTSAPTADLTENWADGRIKQSLIASVLSLRKKKPLLFADGDYVALETDGKLGGHIIAFARVLGNSQAVTIVCRKSGGLLDRDGTIGLGQCRWDDTRIRFPAEFCTAAFSDVLTGGKIQPTESLPASRIFSRLPLALLVRDA